MNPNTEMMDSARFWQIVEDSLAAAQKESDSLEDQQEPQCQALAAALKQLDWHDILAFQNRFKQLLNDSYQGDLWCAAYLMCGGCSDDGFEYFRYWLISRGQAVFEAALANPDSLADVADPDNDYYEFEDFQYTVYWTFEDKTGKEIGDYMQASPAQDINFAWDEDEPESMRRICPRLYAMFA